MADTDASGWTPIPPGTDYGEGIYGASNAGWSWSTILSYTPDMYGGAGGEMMAAGGVTGMPDSGGSSGAVIPGSDGGSSTPPNRDNELTNPNGLPVPSWTPHGTSGMSPGEQLAAQMSKSIASVGANVSRQVNTGEWGMPGYGWSGHFPADPNRATWFGPRKIVDKYQTMPTKHPQGPRVDPSLEQIPEYSQDFDFLRNSPYENEVPYQYFHQIGDVVTFPGNPANDNNPSGPGGAPHNWDNYRRQAYLARQIARALAGNLGQGL